jgi:hypothetical protein
MHGGDECRNADGNDLQVEERGLRVVQNALLEDPFVQEKKDPGSGMNSDIFLAFAHGSCAKCRPLEGEEKEQQSVFRRTGRFFDEQGSGTMKKSFYRLETIWKGKREASLNKPLRNFVASILAFIKPCFV